MKKELLFLFALTISTIHVSAQNYELDNSYVTGIGFNAEVNSSEIDINGKVLFGGDFTSYNGTTRNYLARLNTDGTVDTGFDPSASLSSSVTSLAMHSDNSVTVVTGGALKRFDDVAAEFSGASFTPDAANNVINVVASESTGFVVVIGGAFTDVGGTAANRIARLNADGTIDATFATNIGTGFNGNVRAVEITSSGKILIGGDFTTFNGVARSKIALLNSDGTLDTGFVPGNNIDPLTLSVYSVAMQDDGKILAGTYTGFGTARLARMNADGTGDFYGSIPSGSFVQDIYTNGTNNIIIGGWFAQGVVAKDYTDGSTIDIAVGNGIEGTSFEVNTIAVQADGAIIVSGLFTSYNGISTTNVVRIAICAVSIDTQPSSASTCEINNASFTVAASGTGTLSYQWQENTTGGSGDYTDITDGGIYAGATTSTLDLTAVTSGMNGYYYRCLVTDDNCTTTTGAVTLTVHVAQVITADPVDETVCDGGSASFSVTYTGTGGGWQWQEDAGIGFSDISNGGIYSGANSSTLNLSSVTSLMHGYKYRLESTLCNPATVTISATLTVNPSPVITQQPVTQALCVSGDVSYTIAGTGGGPLTYQWQYYVLGNTYVNLSDGAIYTGTNTATLSVTGADNTLAELYDADNTDGKTSAAYRCIITSNGCSANSELTYLNIHDVPVITMQPVSEVGLCDAGSGVNTSFEIASSITSGGFPYQWQVDDGAGYVNVANDAIYSGATTQLLTLTGAPATFNGFLYRCEIGACASPVYSSLAIIEIEVKPVLVQSPVATSICEGSDATFTVEVTGSNLIYQWQEFAGSTYADITDNATYFGTSTATLQVSAATSIDAYRYRCVVSNGPVCQVTSGNALFRVYSQPTLTNATSVSALTVCDGGTTTLRVNPSSTTGINAGVFTYQWQEGISGTDIFTDIIDTDTYVGSNTNQLQINNVSLLFNGLRYRCVIRGCEADIPSTPETITVNQLPLVITSPQSQTVCKGDLVTFTTSATGTGVTYLWQLSTDNGVTYNTASGYSGYTTSTMTISSALPSQSGYRFKCVASSASPCTIPDESFEATLTVNEVTLTAALVTATICNGENASFTISVLGNGLTYQWQLSGSDLADGGIYSGVNTATLSITGANSASIGINNTYTCLVSSSCGNVSASGNLVINGVDKPVISAEFSNSGAPTLSVFNVSGDSYEWFLNGNSASSNTTHTVTEEGSYTVIVSSNGCVSEISDPFVVLVTATNKDFGNEVRLFPNPAKDKLVIMMDKIYADAQLKILGLDGKVKLSQQVTNLENTVNMGHLPSGIYMIQIRTSEGNSTYKVIKE
jgi:uncharacterized delta-60 repeat protein